MAETTIEWTAQYLPDGRVIPGFTFNPWVGCAKVHEGCAHCYAERDFDQRRHFAKWGLHGTRVVTSPANWKKPIQWNEQAAAEGVRYRVFCSSLADVFEDWTGPMHSSRKVSDDWSDGEKFNPVLWHRNDIGVCEAGETTAQRVRGERLATMADVRRRLFRLIDATPHLDWLLLTKRPQSILRMWPCEDDTDGDGDCEACSKGRMSCKKPRANVWLGTSISLQEHARKQVPDLQKCRHLSPVLFLSVEPMLGPIDLNECGTCDIHRPGGERSYTRPLMHPLVGEARRTIGYEVRGGLDWVICGGESGPNARPPYPPAVRFLRDQCVDAGVAFNLKQWGEWRPPKVGEEYNTAYGLAGNPAAFLVGPDFNTHCFYPSDSTGTTPEQSQYQPMIRVWKKDAGRVLDGREWNESPSVKAVI